MCHNNFESGQKQSDKNRNKCSNTQQKNNKTHEHYGFFISNRVSRVKVKVRNCLEEHMIAEYLTKPLNGTMLWWFCIIIMAFLKDIPDMDFSNPKICNHPTGLYWRKYIHYEPTKWKYICNIPWTTDVVVFVLEIDVTYQSLLNTNGISKIIRQT